MTKKAITPTNPQAEANKADAEAAKTAERKTATWNGKYRKVARKTANYKPGH